MTGRRFVAAYEFSNHPTNVSTLRIQCKKRQNSAHFYYTTKSTWLQLSIKIDFTHTLSCDATEVFLVYNLNNLSQKIGVYLNET